MPKYKLFPWKAEKKTNLADRWRMAQEVANRLEDSPPGSFATNIENDTLVFGVISGDGSLHMFEGIIRSSTVDEDGRVPSTPPKVMFQTEGAPDVNSFSRRPNRA